jgi:hypothetical protein
MRQSFLALFRGRDGRALSRALGVLLFVAAVAGQFPLGLHAAIAGNGPVICAAGGDAPVGGPVPAGVADCCLAVCSGSAAAAVDSPAPTLSTPASAFAGRPALPALIAAAYDSPIRLHPPRGPPFLA